MPDCYKCAAKGHACVAQTVDPENNRPICVFCADGVECLFIKKQRASASTAVAPIARRETVTTKSPVRPPSKPNSEVRTCSVDGCNIALTARNQSGRCTKHWYVKKGDRPQRSSSRKQAVSKQSKKTVTQSDDSAVTTVSVTALQLNDWFSQRPLPERAAIFQSWLNGQMESLRS